MTEKLPPFPKREKDLPRPIGKSLADMRTCGVCGQMFDMRDLLHADHHSADPHAPLA